MTEPPEENRKILKKRAEAAAAAPKDGAGAREQTQFLEFALAGERYAVELALVREVCAGKRITHIPGAPPHIAGVANIRGQILPVADLALFFGIGAGTPGPREIVILRARAPEGTAGEIRELCVMADTVCGVRQVSAAEIQPPPPGFTGIHAKYLGGITQEGLIIFLAGRFLEADHGTAAEKNGRHQ
ncbi:MAG TPA: chemotaxis protein CheW [Elusimicrobia bacterium]|nr:chemotaxis protein CheW [Elusimicrobiota bacterium]